jgi:UDP-glucose-4-epimerase GalE
MSGRTLARLSPKLAIRPLCTTTFHRARELRTLGASDQSRHPRPRNAARGDALLRYFGCAALRGGAYVGESVINPQKYYDNNVVGTLSLLRAMLETNTPTVVFSSSCAIYGEPKQVPITEAAPKQPVNPYGASKLMIERVLSDYTRAYGLQSIALRYFNAAGADPDSEVGELRDPETHLIPRAMMAIQGYLSDFAVFGSDYPTPDGTAIRDYIHVADLAEAHVAALRGLQSGRPNGA